MKLYFTIVILVVLGCAANRVPYSFGRTAVGIDDMTAVIQIMAGLDYPIEFKDEKSGVLNTGWYNFNVQRGLLNIPWAMRSRALFLFKPGEPTQMTFECQASYGSALGGQQWQPLNTQDKDGIKVADDEKKRIEKALGNLIE